MDRQLSCGPIVKENASGKIESRERLSIPRVSGKKYHITIRQKFTSKITTGKRQQHNCDQWRLMSEKWFESALEINNK